MKTIKQKLMIIMLSAIALASCGGGSNQPATPINEEQFATLNESKENDGKRFSITGYPFIGSSVMNVSNFKAAVSLTSEPKGKGIHVGSVELGYQDKKNGVYFPDNYTPEDLIIYDNEGNKLGCNDKITISFTLKLDLSRKPNASSRVKKDENGHLNVVKTAPRYFGDHTDVKVEKAQ